MTYKLSVSVPAMLWNNAIAQAGTTSPSKVIQAALLAYVGDYSEKVKNGLCFV